MIIFSTFSSFTCLFKHFLWLLDDIDVFETEQKIFASYDVTS